MSAVRDYLLTFDKDKKGAANIASSTAQELEAKSTSLIDIIQSLGEYINDEDTTVRSKAVHYLSDVIAALSPDFLSLQQVQVLSQFLCDRIEDGGAINGLRTLSTLRRFNDEMAVMTFRAIIGHFQDLQIRPQSQRWIILKLLNNLMSGHRSAIRALEHESLVGIADLVSGEKDPRNLMMIFSILRVIMIEWDISNHAETLFDSVFCYFPITFRPPPDDPYGITANDLKTRLRQCISASSYFAPYAFPRLIDKLDSTSMNAKRDVLQTIAECATSYNLATMSTYSTTLWDALKYEILNVQDEELAADALESLKAIAIRLSDNPECTDPKSALSQYLKPVLRECNEHLQAPLQKLAKPAGQILKSIGAASPYAILLIAKGILPPILTLYQDASSVAQQRAFLEMILHLLDSAIGTYGHTQPATAPLVSNPFGPFKDQFIELFSQALMSTTKEEISFRIVASKCLVRLCSFRNYLQDDEIGIALQYFNEIILREDHAGRDDLKNEATMALVAISRFKPKLVTETCFPVFLAQLPDKDLPGNQDYLNVLEGLARISTEKAVSETLIRRILNKLDAVLQSEASAAYIEALLATLHHAFRHRELTSDPNLNWYYDRILVGLIGRTAQAAAGELPLTALNGIGSLEILGRLTILITRALDTSKQSSVAREIYTLFSNSFLKPVLFSNENTLQQRSTMIISTCVLAGLNREVQLDASSTSPRNYTALLNRLIGLSLMEDSLEVRLSILRHLAILVNKFITASEISQATDLLWKPATGLFEDANLTDDKIRVIFWTAKALVLRLASTEKLLDYLIKLLSDAKIGVAAARGFGLLLAPDELMCKENGAIVRLLYKQKVFNICIPAIATALPTADAALKPNYLIALSGILNHVSTDILMQEIDRLLPLLLQSLDLIDQNVKAASIETLTILSQESPRAVEEHVSSLIKRLLDAATNPKTNRPEVRFAALRCLKVFPQKIKERALLPYRRQVTKGITAALDDPKRHIRKEAVDCMVVWMNVDEPTDDD